jgi:hypothetical protein
MEDLSEVNVKAPSPTLSELSVTVVPPPLTLHFTRVPTRPSQLNWKIIPSITGSWFVKEYVSLSFVASAVLLVFYVDSEGTTGI